MRGPGFGALELFDESCATIVGLGHDPEQQTSLRTRLVRMNENFRKAKWDMVPVFQKLGKLSCV
eukprot:1867120-Lingulodinium_polyedra.AAC.1